MPCPCVKLSVEQASVPVGKKFLIVTSASGGRSAEVPKRPVWGLTAVHFI